MKCPQCGWQLAATPKQQEAYKLVHCVGLTHREVGRLLGLSRAAISGRLARLIKKYPDLVTKGLRSRKILRYDPDRDYGLDRRF
jgi:hypothetical protein